MAPRKIALAIVAVTVLNVLVLGVAAPAHGEAHQVTTYLMMGARFRYLREFGVISVNEQLASDLAEAGTLPAIDHPDDLAAWLAQGHWDDPFGDYSTWIAACTLIQSVALLTLAVLLWTGARKTIATIHPTNA
ncbi:MAG: hypothetical protein IT431_12770 [Phycisphaerales bacterium]|nr:hypothetical protein [Phycisphaerales bacterium]